MCLSSRWRPSSGRERPDRHGRLASGRPRGAVACLGLGRVRRRPRAHRRRPRRSGPPDARRSELSAVLGRRRAPGLSVSSGVPRQRGDAVRVRRFRSHRLWPPRRGYRAGHRQSEWLTESVAIGVVCGERRLSVAAGKRQTWATARQAHGAKLRQLAGLAVDDRAEMMSIFARKSPENNLILVLLSPIADGRSLERYRKLQTQAMGLCRETP